MMCMCVRLYVCALMPTYPTGLVTVFQWDCSCGVFMCVNGGMCVNMYLKFLCVRACAPVRDWFDQCACEYCQGLNVIIVIIVIGVTACVRVRVCVCVHMLWSAWCCVNVCGCKCSTCSYCSCGRFLSVCDRSGLYLRSWSCHPSRCAKHNNWCMNDFRYPLDPQAPSVVGSFTKNVCKR